jgi:3',5'-cyclic AMP phosphodiesterase CpdA
LIGKDEGVKIFGNNPMFNVMHISDVHFGSDEPVFSYSALEAGVVEILNEINDEEVFLLVTGDITFKGKIEGYRSAERFIMSIISQSSLTPSGIILCPGNHDVVRAVSSPFTYFDAFSYSIRSDPVFLYSASNCTLYGQDQVVFLGINSAYRLDHTYGSADIRCIREALSSFDSMNEKKKIAFLHHNLIGQFETDSSTLRNAYELLLLLDEYRFDYIFHGHQHSKQALPIGRSKIQLFGVRSMNFNTPGYPNGFNHYKLSEDNLTLDEYVYSNDVVKGGKVGGFLKVSSEEIKKA